MIKYHVWKRGGVWFVRLRQRTNGVWAFRNGLLSGGHRELADALTFVKRHEAHTRDMRAAMAVKRRRL